MEADTKKSTKVRLQELKCSALYCDRGDRGARYKTPKLEVGQAFVLLMNHVDTVHPLPAPPTSSSYQTLTDSVKLPAVPSIAAMDTYGLLTRSLPGEVKTKSSAEPASKSETRCSDGKHAADHEAICTNSQVGNKFDKITALPELIKSAAEVDQLATSDVDRQAKKAAKKARQRAAKYGHEKLLPEFIKTSTAKASPKTSAASMEIYKVF